MGRIIHLGRDAERASALDVTVLDQAARAMPARRPAGPAGRPRPRRATEPEPLHLELRRAIEGA